MAEGDTQAGAYKKLYPNAHSAAHVSGHNLYHQAKVKARIAEIQTEIAMRSCMTLSRKREILRQMVEGSLPTKVVRTPNGRLTATFDKLSALITDARIAGEFAPERHEIINANDLRLQFKSKGRNTAIVEAEITPVEEKVVPALPAPEGSPEPPEPDFSVYQNAPVSLDQPQLDTL